MAIVTGAIDTIRRMAAYPFRFDCIFYYVRDLERSIRFYTDVLGLVLTSRDDVARFDIDGVLFELVPTGEDDLLSGRGNARLTLAVTDMNAAVAMLERDGVRTSPIRAVSNGQITFLRDPDGNEICLWQSTSRDESHDP